MTAIFDYFQQYTKVLTTEPPKILDIDVSYLRVFTDMVCVVDGSYSSRKVFLIPEVMKCFTYIYPNRYCSAAQFDDFGNVMNMYYEYQLSSTRLFNELKKEQARNVAPVFPVHWYVIATMPMFEVSEQHLEEAVEEAKEAKAVEEVKEVKEEDSDNDDDVYVSPNVSFIEDDSDDFDY